jgi:aldose 1-epimerase
VLISNGALTALIATNTGNQVQSLKANGREILWMPAETGKLGGIPLLAPWANRIDGDAYFANGKRYLINDAAAHIRRDANGLPIHGLLLFCDGWRVLSQTATSVTSRLEFWRQPGWMAQFPFAHAMEITHRIHDGALEVETAIENHSGEPMPLCIGFHPYFQLSDAPRDEWNLTIPAGVSVILDERLIPTGEMRVNNPLQQHCLDGVSLDAVFAGLTAGEAFVAEGRRQRILVKFGPKYPVAIVYAPAGQPFFCFEPMTTLTNAFNLDHAGLAAGIKAGLQHIAPGATWRESFWIKPEGF